MDFWIAVNFFYGSFLFVSIVISNILTTIRIQYHSSIQCQKRNVFIYLDTVLIIFVDVIITEQCGSLLLKHIFGNLPTLYAFAARNIIVSTTLLFHEIILSLFFMRIFSILQVV